MKMKHAARVGRGNPFREGGEFRKITDHRRRINYMCGKGAESGGPFSPTITVTPEYVRSTPYCVNAHILRNGQPRPINTFNSCGSVTSGHHSQAAAASFSV